MRLFTSTLSFCLFFILRSLLSAQEQTLRSKWISEEECSSLYRVCSADYRTELLVVTDENLNNFRVARFIFESPFFLAGTIKPIGLYRFMEMDSLLSRDELKKRSGYTHDSSAGNLENPGVALILFDRFGCVYERHDHESFNSGIWLNTEPFSYTSFDLAMDFYHSGESEISEDLQWFRSDAPVPRGDLWHSAGDLRYEASFFSARIRTACSGGSHFMAGITIMPEISFYLDSLLIHGRFWQSSGYYRNARAEPPEWNWQWEGLIQYYAGQIYWEALCRGGQPWGVSELRDAVSYEYSIHCRKEGLHGDWNLKGCFESDPYSEDPYSLKPEASCSCRYHFWTAGLGASARWEGIPYVQNAYDISCKLKYSPSEKIANSFNIAYSADRKTAAVKPSLETLLKWRQWSFKGKAVCLYGLTGRQTESPYSFSVMVEWCG